MPSPWYLLFGADFVVAQISIPLSVFDAVTLTAAASRVGRLRVTVLE